MRKLNNDAILVQPCPVHGRKPEMWGGDGTFALFCPVPGCECTAEYAPTRTLAIEEWDAMTYGLTGLDGTPNFPLLAMASGDDDMPDPFEPEEEDFDD